MVYILFQILYTSKLKSNLLDKNKLVLIYKKSLPGNRF